MKTMHLLATLLLTGAALTACNKPEAPAKTEADVMRATAEGQAEVSEAAAEAVTEHVENAADAREDGKPMSASELKEDVDNLHEVDTTIADARYQIAKEQCDALTGDQKDGCLTNAKTLYEAELGQAKAEQKAAKAAISNTPK